MNPVEFVLLVLLGLGAGTYGTLIGAGGGFLMVPVLLLAYADATPATVTGISLAVVFINAISGVQAYARLARIDYRTGFAFAALTVPGSIVGRAVIGFIPTTAFKLVFGLFLSGLAVYIFYRPARTGGAWERLPPNVRRKLIVPGLGTYEWGYNRGLGLAISFVVGFLSSLLGVGGGIVMVPSMVQVLNFPAHIATATSTFILLFTSLTGAATDILARGLITNIGRILPLALGVLGGAQLGARISQRIGNRFLVRLLAVALFFVGIRLIGSVFGF